MRILGTGDLVLGSRRLRARVDPEVLSEIDNADAVMTNAEFTTPTRDRAPMPRGFVFGPDATIVDELVDLGIELVSFANNHAGDFGPQGVIDTLEAFESRGLRPSGVGRSLAEARAARLLDTKAGRVGFVSASATRAAEFAAADAGTGTGPRAGLNPLRWTQTYELPPEQFAQLQEIDRMLGTAEAHEDFNRVELRPGASDDFFEFGSVQATGAVRIRKADRPAVVWTADNHDVEALCAAVTDARGRAEEVVVSLHSHEGENDGWYSDQPAEFLRMTAHALIDAGASVVFGHGPHMMRGVEVYKGVPICYSLNSLTLDFDMGETIPPEMYTSYGLPKHSHPWDLHGMRRQGADGRFQGFYAEERFDRGALGLLNTSGKTRTFDLVPIRFGLREARPSDRGLPRLARGQQITDALEELTRLSEPFGTEFTLDDDTGRIRVALD